MATDMYRAKAGSPTTVITGNLTASTDTIPVQDIAALTAAPGLATLLDGTGNQEVILYTGISGNDLTGVTRGFEGDARSWATGTFISRRLTANDINAQKANIEELQTSKVDTSAFDNHSTQHETGGTDEINLTGLQGESAELATHKAERVQQRPHGIGSIAGQSYESGNWTPVWGGETTLGTVSNVTRNIGRYIKIGDLVYLFVSADLILTGASGNLRVSGIPFTASSDFMEGGAVHFGNLGVATLVTAANRSQFRVYRASDNTTVNSATLPGNLLRLNANIIYRAT